MISLGAIVGIYQFNNESVQGNHIYIMMKELQKFLVDDAVLWQQKNIFLGCHSTRMICESVEKDLPNCYNARLLAITADTEVANRNELFDSLEINRLKRAGLRDSELILLAYQKWGEELPRYLVGDFAFMIWDGKEQKLFGVRDYSGTRPIYYFHDQKHFAFCTLIQPLLLLPFVEKSFNEVWIADFFLASPDGSDSNNPSSTIYKNIIQVPPSHTISVCDGRVKVKKYSHFINR